MAQDLQGCQSSCALYYTTAVTIVMMKMSTLSTMRIMPAHQLLRGE